MYELSIYLGEVPDGKFELSVGDTPILKVTVYDADGEAFGESPAAPDWGSGFSAELVIHRGHTADSDDVVIDEMIEVSPDTDNVFYFDLSGITFEQGDYEAVLKLEGIAEPPDFTTPELVDFSFLPFVITVR